MQLRGFDDYEISLGDQMRGQRATLGLGLADVEKTLRIRQDALLGIENADLSRFRSDGVVRGHVVAYARHLGLDPDACYRRFCAETGFRSPNALQPAAAVGVPDGTRVAFNSRAGASLTASRFSAPPTKWHRRVEGGAVASVMATVALAGLLGYGGQMLVRHLERGDLPPLHQALALTATPEEPGAAPAEGAARRPDASAYEENGALSVARADDLPPMDLATRDGPIADLDAASSGAFAARAGGGTQRRANPADRTPGGGASAASAGGGVQRAAARAGAEPGIREGSGARRPAPHADARAALAGGRLLIVGSF